MADEAASLLVRITADGSQAVGVLNGVAATVETLANKNASLLNKVSSVGTLAGSVGRVMIKTFGVATAAGLTASAKAAGQFNKELANIGTLSVPTERLHEFKGQIQDIAITTGKSTSDISDGTYQVVSAFGDAADTMEKVEINAKAAKAGLATTTDSINLTSAVTKAYGDTSAQAVQHVADLAFKTVELGQTTFPELASSMQQVTSLSKELGVSQEELFGAYATLTGVTGNAAEVQTQMKAVYTALLKPSDNMAKVIKNIGYESGYSMINSLGFAGTLDALKKATNGSEEEMLGLFNNVRAMPAVMALTGAQSDTFATKLEKMKNASGAATKAFEVQTEGVAKTGFTLEQAKVKMQVAAQNFGESAAPMIADFADIVDKASTKLSTMSDEERKAIINTGVLTTKIGVGLSVGGKALTLGTKLVGTAKAIGTVLPALKSATAVFGSAVAPLVAPAAIITGYHIISKYVGEAIENNSKLGQSYKELYDTWKDAEGNAEHISALRDEYAQLNNSINSGQFAGEELEAAKNRISAIIEEIKKLTNDDTIKLMIDTGDYEAALDLAVADAKNASDEINDALGANNYKDAQKAVFEAYDAVSAGSGLSEQYKERRNSAQQWIQEATKFEEQYRKILNNTRKAEESGNKIGRRAFEKERNDLIKSMQASGFTDTYTALTGNDFKFEDMDGIIAQVQNVKNAYKELNDELTASDERAANGRKSLQAMAQVAQDSAMELNGFDNMEEVFAAGGNAVNNTITQLKANMSDWGFANEDIAAQMALFRNGFDSLQGAIDNNALDAVIKDFISDGEKIGLTSTQIIEKAALMKNGFSDIEQALSKGDISGVINDLGKLGGDMGMSVAQVDALAHSLGLIPEDKHIELTVNGYELVEGMAEKLKELDTENVHVFVNADGDLTVLNQATGETKNLQELGAVSLQVNADGNIDVLNQAGEKVAEIQDNPSATITVNTELEETTEDTTVTVDADAEPAKEKISALNQEQVKVPVDANTDAADAKIKSLSQTIEVTAHYTATGDVPKGRAKGDMNFSGGIAMVNDERGINDNRELIVDRGRAFIPEGRDVILPLSRGAKVYTAAQTKAIMSGLGIPHYASGKNNSDAFTAAKDDWTHYTKTHSVTTEQELEKWLEFQEKYKDNEKDIWDIEEQVFSLQQKLYSERVKESENWLRHEEKYNGMAASDYLAGIDRMKAYTTEYYEQGIINHKEYTEAMADLDEKYIDKRKEQLEELYNLSVDYISEHTYFNDWKDSGDDPLEAYNRVMERNREALANGELTQKEFDAYGQKLGSSMYSERKEQSLNWLEEQRKYFGMTDEEYVQGLERIKTYTQEYYNQGLISRREYNEAMTELNHSSWDEASEAYEDMLKERQDYINKMQEEFQKQEQALRDSWEVEDRRVDMATVQGQLDIYAGAVTDRGQQKYKELEEQMKQLQRDEELYQLQVKNTATIDALQADYEAAENMKADYLKNIVTNTDINVSGIVGELTAKLAGTGDNITNMLGQLLNAFQNFKVEQSYYNDNSQTTINAADNVDVMAVIRKNAGLDR